jgi:hypothetical protein
MPTISKDSPIYTYYPVFKWGIYSLLAINVVLFFMHQTFIEGLETPAWVVLLLLFEWETSQLDKPYINKWEKYTIHIGRIICYIVIVYSAYEYATPEYRAENGPLDMYNSLTWLGIIILLEYDVYASGLYGKTEWYIRNTLKVILYAALFVYAAMWGIQGAFLDFYDAALWIICFFAIELNIFKFEDSLPYNHEVEPNAKSE